MYCVFEKIYQMIDFVLQFCTTGTDNTFINVPASLILSGHLLIASSLTL